MNLLHTGSDSHSLLLIQQITQPFILLRDISTSKSDVIVHQTLRSVRLQALPLYKTAGPVNDLLYAISYATYTYSSGQRQLLIQSYWRRL